MSIEREPEVRATLIVVAELARFARDLATDTEAACAEGSRDIAEAAGLPPPTFEHGSCDALRGVIGSAVHVLSRGNKPPPVRLTCGSGYSLLDPMGTASACSVLHVGGELRGHLVPRDN